MTAFSRQQADREWGSLTWELRSINHRYLETSVRLPESFRGLENVIRDTVRKKLNRGKIECQLRFQALETSQSDLQLNKEVIAKLVRANSEINKITDLDNQLTSVEILRWPGVVADQGSDADTIEKEALDLFIAALDDLVSSRAREGEALKGMLNQRIVSIREIVASIRGKMPDIICGQRKNLFEKLEELKAELEPTRLEQEIAILAQKADVDEELDRLDSHLDEVGRVIESNGQKGRRLDFLMQELNREANTLSSKSIVVDTTLGAVELKVLIEQMREQIQNVE
ncbi:MAG: YicC/YloC family endoribonuclease [Pseudomonadota bacterium]|nr:YicC/YloC family endoribonuclease [Pseudomonadota bacterium]